jgi:hypothetical protein
MGQSAGGGHGLVRRGIEQPALWVSSTTGRQLTTKNLGTLIARHTRETIGVDVSPPLFRSAWRDYFCRLWWSLPC